MTGGEARKAPDIVAPPPGHPRFPLFDALRAIAALSILLVHAALLSGVFEDAWYRRFVAHMDIGVTIFFLLSGFLLYRPFVASAVLGAPGIRIRDYARRRFLRIAPAYWVALTALAIFPGLAGVFSGNWWVYYGLLQNYPVYTLDSGCIADPYRCGIAPTWTLAVEVAFYAVLPFLALALGRIRANLTADRWPFAELAALGVLALGSVAIQAMTIDTDGEIWLFYSPLGRFWWFGLGMALAVLSVRAEETGRRSAPLRWAAARPAACWGAALALYVGACLVLVPKPSLAFAFGISREQYVAEYVLFGLIAALVILPAAFRDPPRGLPSRVLAHPVLAWLGLISYGIFLWHFPILFGLARGDVDGWWPEMGFPVMVAIGASLTTACAALSYYLVERPLMRLK